MRKIILGTFFSFPIVIEVSEGFDDKDDKWFRDQFKNWTEQQKKILPLNLWIRDGIGTELDSKDFRVYRNGGLLDTQGRIEMISITKKEYPDTYYETPTRSP